MSAKHSTVVLRVLVSALLLISALLVGGAATTLGAPLANLGDSQADLVYTPLTPCRIIDTREAGAGGPIGANTTRDFKVTGTNLSAQGGSPSGCGVPFGPATAAVINFVAVDPEGAGNLRITPFGTPMPLAAILNYVKITGVANFNLANGLPVTICDPAAVSCSSDFTIQADASGTQLVADVQGFFRKLRTEQVKSFVVSATGGFAGPIFSCFNHGGAQVTVVAPVAGTVVIRGTVVVNFQHVNTVDQGVSIFIGTSATDCSSPTGDSAFVFLPDVMPTSAKYDFSIAARRVVHVAAGSTSTFFLNSATVNFCTPQLVCSAAFLQGSGIDATFIPD